MTGRCEIRQKCAPRDPEKNWNKDQPRKSLPGVPRVGDKNCKKPGFILIKPLSPRSLVIRETKRNPKPIVNLGGERGGEREGQRGGAGKAPSPQSTGCKSYFHH